MGMHLNGIEKLKESSRWLKPDMQNTKARTTFFFCNDKYECSKK
jgi:hypothetical protein